MEKLFFLLFWIQLTLDTFEMLKKCPIGIAFYFSTLVLFFILIIWIVMLLNFIEKRRSIKFKEEQELELQKRKTSIKNYTFPPFVELSLKDYYPLLTKSERERVLECLRLFFIEKLSSIHLDTPSIVLNRAWKAFSLTPEYKSFSSQFFNENFLIYKPILKDSCGVIELTNKNNFFLDLWSSQCHIEKIDPFFPQRVPHMFILDESLNIVDSIKFKIDKTKLRELLNIEDAPLPSQLIKELKDASSQKYLQKKLKYYLNHEGYCEQYNQTETLEELLKMIHKNKSLTKIMFGRYTTIDYLIERIFKKNLVCSCDINNTPRGSG